MWFLIFFEGGVNRVPENWGKGCLGEGQLISQQLKALNFF